MKLKMFTIKAWFFYIIIIIIIILFFIRILLGLYMYSIFSGFKL
ncbi:MAG: hypothetical protein N7Q72_05765 [Spiroplasma sp. Tabriz.8]|nr:hypothetical protein [Spiroplasma sp. Tabriz.8]